MGKILVGVDGSKHAVAALAWAVDDARLRGWHVHVISAWEFPHALNPVTMFTVQEEPFIADATHAVESAIAAVDADGVEMSTEVAEGRAAQVLLHESRSADLVVVGSRGRGEFAGLLLGSVSQYLVANARCSVLVHRDDSA